MDTSLAVLDTASSVPPHRTISWRDDVDPASWDRALAGLGGHPLQSALWGDARRDVDGIRDHRLMALVDDRPGWMIRIEERRLPLLGWVGWAPRGPTGPANRDGELMNAAMCRLRGEGMRLLVTDPWREADVNVEVEERRPRTIWIDLNRGRERLLADLDKQWRYGVRKARQLGVHVSQTSNEDELLWFHALCIDLSQQKGFRAPASLPFMRMLVRSGGDDVEAQLLVAHHDGRTAAGSFLIRCGTSVHYFWGATDRAHARSRAGEAVQWASIEWALDHSCTLYDVEGIDPEGNPGTYAFKKKMGGQEITLEGKGCHTLGVVGGVLAWFQSLHRP